MKLPMYEEEWWPVRSIYRYKHRPDAEVEVSYEEFITALLWENLRKQGCEYMDNLFDRENPHP